MYSEKTQPTGCTGSAITEENRPCRSLETKGHQSSLHANLRGTIQVRGSKSPVLPYAKKGAYFAVATGKGGEEGWGGGA